MLLFLFGVARGSGFERRFALYFSWRQSASDRDVHFPVARDPGPYNATFARNSAGADLVPVRIKIPPPASSMAIKIISGMLLPTAGDHSYGSAVIDLKDGQLLTKDCARMSDVSILGNGKIVAPPAVQLSLRHIVSSDEEASFNLNHQFVFEGGAVTGVSVSWHAEPKQSKILEISVLILAETN